MPAEPPVFSVVVPAYNSEHTILTTLGSVRAQRESDWEAIVVDDGSTDGTCEVVLALAHTDARIRVVQGAHRGVSAARNTGIALARGRYVAFLDADDQWTPDKLALHRQQFERYPQVDVGFSRARFMTATGQPTSTFSQLRRTRVRAADLLYENPTTTCSSVVARRDVFATAGGFDERMSFAEDLEWLVRAACRGARIEGLPAALTLYRTNVDGLSSQLDRMQHGWERLIEQVRAYAPALIDRHYRRAKATHLRYLARRTLRLGNPGAQGCRFMHQALAADWTLLLRQPRRTLGTLVAVHAHRALDWLAIRRATPSA